MAVPGVGGFFPSGSTIVWMFCRHWQPSGFDAGEREIELWIGALNLVLLTTNSFVYSGGLAFVKAGTCRG